MFGFIFQDLAFALTLSIRVENAAVTRDSSCSSFNSHQWCCTVKQSSELKLSLSSIPACLQIHVSFFCMSEVGIESHHNTPVPLIQFVKKAVSTSVPKFLDPGFITPQLKTQTECFLLNRNRLSAVSVRYLAVFSRSFSCAAVAGCSEVVWTEGVASSEWNVCRASCV